jgi:hypothetical protein
MPRIRSLAVAAPLLLMLAAPAQATTGAEIVSFLNAQRAANGIPAGIVEDPGLSAGCAKHNHYGALNNELTHGEDPAKPGYTAEGDQAGKTSVLYQGASWTATSNAFETAPIHLHQLLAPRIDVMGAAESEGFGCATSLASLRRPAPPAQVTYTYPGNDTKNVPTSEVAREGPYTPGQQVGIAEGATTGPYLFVLFDGPAQSAFDPARVQSASLTGPSGAVPIATVDNTTNGLTDFLPTGAQIIPRAALAPNTTYTASISALVASRNPVTFQSGGDIPFQATWRFTTAAPPPPPFIPAQLRPARLSASRSSKGVVVSVRCSAACVLKASGKVTIPGRRAVTVSGTARRTKAGTVNVTLKLTRANRARVRSAGRRARVRVTVKATGGGSVKLNLPIG